MPIELLTDARAFLESAQALLAADPVASTVVTTVAHRVANDGDARLPDPHWWLVVRDDDGRVVGAGMRTAPFPPFPAYLLAMPDAAAVALARELHARGEALTAVNGAMPASLVFATELARLRGRTAHVAQQHRLHRLTKLAEPRPVAGRLVRAADTDVDLAVAWWAAFAADADLQAGRPAGTSAHDHPDADTVRSFIQQGRVWFWVDDADRRVHMTAVNAPSFGVARIGPVYTPPSQRGRGYAANAVAAMSRTLLNAAVVPCLFTDLENPTSNRLYESLGYEPVVDTVGVTLR